MNLLFDLLYLLKSNPPLEEDKESPGVFMIPHWYALDYLEKALANADSPDGVVREIEVKAELQQVKQDVEHLEDAIKNGADIPEIKKQLGMMLHYAENHPLGFGQFPKSKTDDKPEPIKVDPACGWTKRNARWLAENT